MEISGVPAFDSNYLWVLSSGGRAAVVDPGDAAAVQAHLDAHGLALEAILATHHHADHVGGVAALAARWKCPVYGPVEPRIAGITHPVREGDRVALGFLGPAFEVIEVPGHTSSHVAYWQRGEPPRLFCGDTLFACGCGRLFEGTPAQMNDSLAKLAALDPRTLAYCAHEYTLANIAFARAADPANAALRAREAREKARRDRGEPTVPMALAEELETNPFLRCATPGVREAAERHAGRALAGPVDVFATIREWKNRFPS